MLDNDKDIYFFISSSTISQQVFLQKVFYNVLDTFLKSVKSELFIWLITNSLFNSWKNLYPVGSKNFCLVGLNDAYSNRIQFILLSFGWMCQRCLSSKWCLVTSAVFLQLQPYSFIKWKFCEFYCIATVKNSYFSIFFFLFSMLTPHCHFHPLHRHLDISWAITAEGSPLHIAATIKRSWELSETIFLSTFSISSQLQKIHQQYQSKSTSHLYHWEE